MHTWHNHGLLNTKLDSRLGLIALSVGAVIEKGICQSRYRAIQRRVVLLGTGCALVSLGSLCNYIGDMILSKLKTVQSLITITINKKLKYQINLNKHTCVIQIKWNIVLGKYNFVLSLMKMSLSNPGCLASSRGVVQERYRWEERRESQCGHGELPWWRCVS